MSYVPTRPRSRLGYLGLGADVPVVPEVLSQEEYQRRMLALQTELRDWQKRWVINDEKIRYIGIAATLAIPLAAAVWRVILGRRAVGSTV